MSILSFAFESHIDQKRKETNSKMRFLTMRISLLDRSNFTLRVCLSDMRVKVVSWGV